MAYGGEIAALASDYRERGRKEAAAHRPPTDALHPDQHEVALRGRANDCLNNAQQQFEAEVSDASRVAAEIHRRLADLENHIRQLLDDSSLDSTANVKMADRQSELAQVAEERIRAEVQYRDFRARNYIAVEPHYPDSHVWHFAIVALCFLAETSANAIFFSNAAGLLAGYGVAIGLAAVNIASAMVLGMGFRYKNVAAVEMKSLGWFCLFAFLVLSIYLNALFSSYRSAYQLLVDPTDAGALISAFGLASTKALQIFILDMHISDLTSFLLFGFGLFLSGLAFWKGYTYDDEYPDHGRLHRFLLAAKEKETQRSSALRDEVASIIHQYRGELSSALNEPGQLQTRATNKLAALAVAQSGIEHDIRAITNDHNLVLDAYRQINTSVRGTETPAYFKEVAPLIVSDPAKIAAPKAEELQIAKQTAMGLRERVQAELNRKIEDTNRLATRLLTEGLEQFMLRVDQIAKDTISRNTPTIHRTA
jgi:hypothetical protein